MFYTGCSCIEKVDCHKILHPDEPQDVGDVSTKIYRKIFWIATESVGRKLHVVQAYHDRYKQTALGGITLTIRSEDSEFFEHWKKLKPKENNRNIWFDKFWEQYHNCSLSNTACKKKSSEKMREVFSKINPTIQAAQAFIKAFEKLQNKLCSTGSGICTKMNDYFSKSGEDFFNQYLTKVTIENNRKITRVFEDNGELAQPRYEVHQYQYQNDGRLSFVNVGDWSEARLEEGPKLHLDIKKLSWLSPKQELLNQNIFKPISPTSSCPTKCPLRYGLKEVGGSDCCKGVCTPCLAYEYVDDDSKCRDCAEMSEEFWPSENKTTCVKKGISILLPITMIISLSGVILTVVCLVTFLKYQNTPVVRHSCKEHCIIALVGILILFLLPPLLEIPRYRATCILFRFIMPLGSSMMYSALLVKINRMYRIFYLKLQEKNLMKLKAISVKPAYVDVTSQLLMIACFVGLGLFITVILCVYDVPDAIPVYPERDAPYKELMKKCSFSMSTMMVSHFYSIFLIISCTYYAVLTRKIPDNFKETQNIGFAMYATCILWLSCIGISFGLQSKDYETKMRGYGIAVSISTLSVLVCVFFPKTYIILFEPEKNTRKKPNVNEQLRSGGSGAHTTSKLQSSFSTAEDTQQEYTCSKCNSVVSED